MPKALIIGGGIAGPVTAMALRKAGIEAHIYEAYDHGADGVGAYLTVAINGMAALRTLDLHTLVRRVGFDSARMTIMRGNGRELAEFEYGGTLDDGTMSQTVKRADLYQALRDEAVRRGVRVHYGRRLVDAESTVDGVVARFADGTTESGSLLVGADGLLSRTRGIIDPAAPPPRYCGLLNTGGYATGVDVGGEPGTMYMVFGKRCFFGYIPQPGGQVLWFANPPSKRELGAGELAAITPRQWRSRLLDLFAKDRTPAVDLINATEQILTPWNTYDVPSSRLWHKGNIVLVGDAAHATSPTSGQGASQAIEDAVVLAKCLRDAPDPRTAFAMFEGVRRARVERIVAQGKKHGDQKTFGPVGQLFLPLIFRLFAGKDDLSWILEHRLDWDTPMEVPGSMVAA